MNKGIIANQAKGVLGRDAECIRNYSKASLLGENHLQTRNSKTIKELSYNQLTEYYEVIKFGNRKGKLNIQI